MDVFDSNDQTTEAGSLFQVGKGPRPSLRVHISGVRKFHDSVRMGCTVLFAISDQRTRLWALRVATLMGV